MTLDAIADRVRIRTSHDIRDAAVCLRDTLLATANLRVACTDNIASNEPMLDSHGEPLSTSVFGWPEHWWGEPRFALRVPAAEACRVYNFPFWANRSGAYDDSGARILADIDFKTYFGKCVPFAANIVIPVHLPFSQVGVVTLTCMSNERQDFSKELRAHFSEFFLLSNLFISSYAEVMRSRKWLPHRCKLTRLEINCLRWIGRGKTDDEIALILGKARPTIRFHVQNAAAKLGALNRSQAVFHAVQLGYLSSASHLPMERETGVA